MKSWTDLLEIVALVRGKIPGYVSVTELVMLAQWVNRYCGNGYVVNVGVWKGLSLAVMALVRDNDRVVGVDHFEGSSELPAVSKKDLVAECSENLQSVGVCPSLLTLPSVRAARLFDDGDVSFLFLDADHSYEAVKADLTVWVPKLMQGAILMIHDYLLPRADPESGFPGIALAVDELCGDWYRVEPELPSGAEWSSWVGIAP
jgi:predicted O-methyltransferase YrrM